MSAIKNKIVFISGASSGIGQACAYRFAQEGARLILCARRENKLEKVVKDIKSTHHIDVYSFALDVRDRSSVEKMIDTIPYQWQAIDILINNAGLARGLSKLHEGSVEDWDEMIDTNIKGLLYITRKIVPGMIKRGQGDIINIGSIAGHEVYPNGNVYCASKHAVDALTRGLRIDLVGTPLRVCTVDPGLVETEFSIVRFHGDKKRADSVYSGLQPLTAEDIAETVFFCASRPDHVQIAEVIIFPTAQKSSTILHRDQS
jgi:NADP-dependent 3-hydroxy acid dehydrogenase YdfG